jgi:hypothetical protein
VERTLAVRSTFYAPSVTRPPFSATDQARQGFQSPQEWERSAPAMPVRGLGDEATIARRFYPGGKERGVVLTVRLRNAVIQIDVKEWALLEPYWGRVPPVAEVEAAAVAAARQILARLDSRPAPVASVPAYLPGEVRRVGNICDSVGAADRLVPGIRRRDISPAGSALDSGCHWGQNQGRRPSLTVEAEVITPSPATGQTASQIATALFPLWKIAGARALRLGDEAKMHHFDFRSGAYRASTVFLRRGNLLVYVDYGRWNHPSIKMMDNEVINLAKAVLADNR